MEKNDEQCPLCALGVPVKRPPSRLVIDDVIDPAKLTAFARRARNAVVHEMSNSEIHDRIRRWIDRDGHVAIHVSPPPDQPPLRYKQILAIVAVMRGAKAD